MPGRTKITPEALRDRVLSAVPEWADWPRALRQLYTLLPVYGATTQGLTDAAANALHMEWAKVSALAASCPSFASRVTQYSVTKGYPAVPLETPRRNMSSPTGQRILSRSPIARITHREITELLANEQTVVALVQLEIAGPDASPALAKIVSSAGHYANIEEAAEERRARASTEIVARVAEEARRKATKRSARRLKAPMGGMFGRPPASKGHVNEGEESPDTPEGPDVARIES